MPEMSQDVFEITNPPEPPVTVQELRARANSGSSKSGILNLNGSSENGSSSSDQPKTRKKSRTTSVSFKDPISHQDSTIVDQQFGYKREISHR